MLLWNMVQYEPFAKQFPKMCSLLKKIKLPGQKCARKVFLLTLSSRGFAPPASSAHQGWVPRSGEKSKGTFGERLGAPFPVRGTWDPPSVGGEGGSMPP